MSAATASPGGVITGTRIAINVHYDQTEGQRSPGGHADLPPPPPQTGAPSASESASSRSSRDSTPSHRSQSTASPGELVTRLDQQLQQAVQSRGDSQSRDQSPPLPPPPNETSLHNDGPDQVVPSENLFCADRFGAVKLKMGASGLSATQPISIPSLLHRTASRFGHLVSHRWKVDGVWQSVTFQAYLEEIQTVARAFVHLGLEPKGSVCILGFNSREWLVSSLAAVYAGGLSGGVYTTNNEDACFHCADDSHCNIYVVEDEKQLAKVLQFKDKVPSLRAIVQYTGEPSSPDVLSWSQLLDLGHRQSSDEEVRRRQRQMAVNQAAVLIYTSGTTGPPKGVMLSHDNVTVMAQNMSTLYTLRDGAESAVSYLPLSHVAALLVDVFMPLVCGATVWFADKNALKGTLGQTLVEARPTLFMGVPRVFEKIKEGFETKTANSKGLRRSLLEWAMEKGRRAQSNRMKGIPGKPLGHAVARKLVLGKIHRLLGLDRLRLLLVGAAPISKETISFFHSLDLPLLQVYGMSESTGPHTVNLPDRDRLGTVGPTADGFYTRLDNCDATGQGEICMGGRNVFMGYLNLHDKTAETLDDDGWLHSGDLGMVDRDGFVSVTGRLKELIITAGGENIPPVQVEEEVMKELSIVSNCCLIGDRRKFLSMLITLKVDIDLETMEATDRLSAPSLEFCRTVGSSARTVQDVLEGPDEKVMAAIQSGLDRANSRATSNAQRVAKWTILPNDFTIPGGEMGPTMKMKRPAVFKKYADVIERLYA